MGSEESRVEPGRRLRRRDHEYAARAQMPENMYTRAAANSTPCENRMTGNKMMARKRSVWGRWRRERFISLPDQNRQVLTMRNPQVPTMQSQMTATRHAWLG